MGGELLRAERGGASGDFVDFFFGGRPCDHAATISSLTWTCLRFSSSTVVGYSCYVYRDNYPQCKLCSSPSRFLRCRSWTGFDMPVIVQRQVRSLRVKVVDISAVAQRQFPLVLFRTPWRFRCSMSVVQVQQIRVQSVRRQSSSHSCSPLSMDTVVAYPLCAMTDCRWWSMSLLAQFIDGYGRPCDHAVTLCVATVEVCPRFSSSPESVDIPVATEMGTRLLAVVVMAAMKGFSAFVGHFSRSSRLSGVERQFRSPRWRRVLCHRGLPCTIHRTLLTYDIVPSWSLPKQQ